MIETQTSNTHVNAAELRHDLHSMLEAIRMAGSEHEDHYIDLFIHKLARTNLLQGMNKYRNAKATGPGQRLVLAIISLILLMPLFGIVMSPPVLDAGMMLVSGAYRVIIISLACFAIITINYVYNR